MPSRVGDDQKRVSRRTFLTLGGAVAAAGVVISAGLLAPQRESGSDPDADATAVPRDATLPPRLKAPLEPFSIFWITDTQFLSESNPALFEKMTRWIADQWSARNGKMVVHTGDVVQTGSVQKEWQNADAAMSVLLKNGIPYTWCAGNHDDLALGDPTSGWKGSEWTSAFDPSVARRHVNGLQYARWVSDSHAGMNTAVAFSASGLNLLIVTVEWNADTKGVLHWVDSLLRDPAYADHYVVMAPHAYINPVGRTDDPVWGPQLSPFVKGLTAISDKYCSRVFLTLNGHFPTDVGYHNEHSINNRHELMFDRQDSIDELAVPVTSPSTPDSYKVGGATVTVLTFDVTKNLVSVETYDTFAGRTRDDPGERFSFTMLPQLQTPDPTHGAPLSDPASALRSV